jgi:hypothetical protein
MMAVRMFAGKMVAKKTTTGKATKKAAKKTTARKAAKKTPAQ